MHKPRFLPAFTLVELIVVITILAILGTIAFISLQGYALSARDTARINDVKVIEKGISLYRLKNNTLPLPDNAVTLTASGEAMIYQGYAGTGMLATIRQAGEILDPLVNEFYTYSITADKTNFQLLSYFEKSNIVQNISPSVPSVYAAPEYNNMHPRVFGDSIGILVNVADQTPIQENTFSGNTLDVSDTSGIEYKAYLSNKESIQGTGSTLSYLIPNGNCKRLLELRKSTGNGVYTINPGAAGEIEVYCDMETAGGGWTASTMLADITTQNLFDTGNNEKVTSISKNISSKGIISDVWQDSMDKDIMFLCESGNSLAENYTYPFIIKGYKKNDIGNLERYLKGSTIFSSIDLSAEYRGKTINLLQTYGANIGSTSMYIRTSDNNPCYALLQQKTISNHPSADLNCPQYNASNIGVPLSSDNYCVTYIK